MMIGYIQQQLWKIVAQWFVEIELAAKGALETSFWKNPKPHKSVWAVKTWNVKGKCFFGVEKSVFDIKKYQ